MFSSKGGLQTEIWGFIAGSLREKDVHRKINLTIIIEKKSYHYIIIQIPVTDKTGICESVVKWDMLTAGLW